MYYISKDQALVYQSKLQYLTLNQPKDGDISVEVPAVTEGKCLLELSCRLFTVIYNLHICKSRLACMHKYFRSHVLGYLLCWMLQSFKDVCRK